jgi:hypothetical protein
LDVLEILPEVVRWHGAYHICFVLYRTRRVGQQRGGDREEESSRHRACVREAERGGENEGGNEGAQNPQGTRARERVSDTPESTYVEFILLMHGFMERSAHRSSQMQVSRQQQHLCHVYSNASARTAQSALGLAGMMAWAEQVFSPRSGSACFKHKLEWEDSRKH